jgi:hypothetical protein
MSWFRNNQQFWKLGHYLTLNDSEISCLTIIELSLLGRKKSGSQTVQRRPLYTSNEFIGKEKKRDWETENKNGVNKPTYVYRHSVIVSITKTKRWK